MPIMPLTRRDFISGAIGGAITLGAAGGVYGISNLLSYEKPQPGDKFLIEKVVLDAGRDIVTNKENTGFYLLNVKKIELGKEESLDVGQGKKIATKSGKKIVTRKVPYKLVVSGHNLPIETLKSGGQNMDSGRVIEVKDKFIGKYTGRMDGIRRYVYPLERVEIDNLYFWKAEDSQIPEDVKMALDP